MSPDTWLLNDVLWRQTVSGLHRFAVRALVTSKAIEPTVAEHGNTVLETLRRHAAALL